MSKTFLLAGASSAMAQETSRLLQASGHEVIHLSRRQASSSFSGTWHVVPSYRPGSFPALTHQLQGLVYFPGTIRLKPFGRIQPEEFLEDLTVHAMGAAACVQAYLPLLDKTARPSIVLLSSVAATLGLPYHSSVSMAKGAVEGLTRALAAELAPSIRVNAIAPSLVDTPLAARFLDTPDKREAMEKKNPLHRVGSARDMAQLIQFLLSEQADWITGQVLAADGGMKHLKLG